MYLAQANLVIVYFTGRGHLALLSHNIVLKIPAETEMFLLQDKPYQKSLSADNRMTPIYLFRYVR